MLDALERLEPGTTCPASLVGVGYNKIMAASAALPDVAAIACVAAGAYGSFTEHNALPVVVSFCFSFGFASSTKVTPLIMVT